MNQSTETLNHAELISRSWQEIKGRFAPFMLLACIAPAFSWLIAGLAFGLDPMTQSTAQQQQPLLMLLVSLLSALVGSYCTAALILFICKRTDTPWQALKTAWRPFLRLFGGGLLITVVILVVLALLVILWLGPIQLYLRDPESSSDLLLIYGIFAPWVAMPIVPLFLGVLIVYFCLLPYLLVLTDRPVLSCFVVAFRLVKGRFFVTMGLLFLLWLISLGIGIAAGIVLSVLQFIFALASGLLAGILSLLWVPVMGLITLSVQVPLLALYLDRVSIHQAPQETADGQ